MDDEYDDSLRENDPYNDMKAQKKRSIMPDFSALARMGKDDHGRSDDTNANEQKPDGGREEAKDKLRNAEKQSSQDDEKPQSGVAGAKANESSPRGLYTGGGGSTGKKGNNTKIVGNGAKGKLKKYAPMGVIAAVIAGVGSLMVGMQTLMPVAISELIIEKFNSIGISSTEASDVWLDAQLNRAAGVVEKKAGNIGESLFDMTDYQIQSFESQGIKVVKDTSGNILALLYYKNGVYVPVVGSQVIGRAGLVDEIRAQSRLSNIGTPVTVSEAFADTECFKHYYTTATKSWRGGISGWFDEMMSSITEIKLSVSRNRWSRFTAKSINDVRKMFLEMAEGAVANGVADEGIDVGVYNDGDEVDPGGDLDDGLTSLNGSTTVEQVNRILSSKAMQTAQAVAGVVNVGCQLAEAAVSIYTVAAAYQNLQFLNLISGFLESVDKMKAGDGDGSPVNEYSVNLVTVGDTTTLDDHNNEVVVASKTAMESAGMANLFSNVPINSNDASVKNINFEQIMSNLSTITKTAQFSAQIFEACGYANIFVSSVDLVTTVLSVIPIFGQGLSFVKIIVKSLGKIALNALVSAAIAAIIPAATKVVANLVIKKVATEWFGEDLGNAMISASNKYLGGNGTTGGQSPGSLSKVLAYKNMQESVIAQEAEYQRAMRSPFDMTSQHTFLGSLAYSLMPLAYSSSGIMQAIKSASSLTTSSLAALLPTASAISNTSELTSVGECVLQNDINIVADAYCNPYIITDYDTMYEKPIVAYRNAYYLRGYYLHSYYDDLGYYHYHVREGYTASFDGDGNVIIPSVLRFDSEGNMIKQSYGEVGYEYYSNNLTEDGEIINNSQLSKYVVFCGQRVSPYNVKDANIAEEIARPSGALSLISHIPGLSSISDIASTLREKENVAWIMGHACVASEENDMWDENQHYQRYDEDVRLLENTNPGYKSAVTAYLEGYYAENPIDTSFEGTLARFSGMTVEQVDTTLALLEYYEYIADYDPSQRLAFGVPVVEPDDAIFFESDTQIAEEHIILTYEIIYADVRNRVNLV